jgi:hypothetical protein
MSDPYSCAVRIQIERLVQAKVSEVFELSVPLARLVDRRERRRAVRDGR